MSVHFSMIQSVEKALRLLQALDVHGDWIGVRELSRQLGFSPPTTHNLLKTLVAAGFAEPNPATRQYRLGLTAIRLGAGLDPLNSMRLLARPYMERLASEFDETVVVSTWQNEQAVVVDWIQADHPLSVSHNHGIIEHPFVFASGRVLLAHQSPEAQARYAAREDFSSFGANGPKNAAQLRTLLAEVCAQGYAIVDNVNESGVIALGAPVFDAQGRLLLAIGCSAPVSRTTRAQINQVRQRLLALAAEMTRNLRALHKV
jgi:DNA-binding IclR family transcriptional regulator